MVAETADPEGVDPSAIGFYHRCRFNPFRVGSRTPVYRGPRSARLRSAHGYSHLSPLGTGLRQAARGTTGSYRTGAIFILGGAGNGRDGSSKIDRVVTLVLVLGREATTRAMAEIRWKQHC